MTTFINRSIISSIFLFCFFFNLPLFWFSSLYEVIEIDDRSHIGVVVKKECEIEQNQIVFSFVLTSIDTVFYCLVPFLITSMFSSMTLFNLIKSRSRKNNNITRSNGSARFTSVGYRPSSTNDITTIYYKSKNNISGKILNFISHELNFAVLSL